MFYLTKQTSIVIAGFTKPAIPPHLRYYSKEHYANIDTVPNEIRGFRVKPGMTYLAIARNDKIMKIRVGQI